LNAGKHVLCEKPVTVNSAELRALLKLAKEKNLFLMEAMWTRFQPIAHALREATEDPRLGELVLLCVAPIFLSGLHADVQAPNCRQADLSGDFDINS